MVVAERLAVEVIGEEHVVVECVLDHDDRPEAVETVELDMGDNGAGAQHRLDAEAVEVGERHALPMQVDRGPARDAVEVGMESSAGSVARSVTDTANISVTAPPISRIGSAGIFGVGPLRCVPKRGNQSTSR